MLNLKNPFLVSGYCVPAYFCDREESAKIISALSNDHNVLISGVRRMGKTGLIHHVFHQLREQDASLCCFYMDIFSTQNLHDFVTQLGKTIIGKLDEYSEMTIGKLTTLFKSFHPSFTVDTLTDKTNLTLNIPVDKDEECLREIFAYLRQAGKQICFAIDEFQQVMSYPEKGVEELLRSEMEFLPHVKFIFAGSRKLLMQKMKTIVTNPLHRSIEYFDLGKIPLESYRTFAINSFNSCKKSIDSAVFDYIYSELSGHTWYIQYVLNKLFCLEQDSYTIQDVMDVIDDTLEEENFIFKTYCEQITKAQLRLLRAIAVEDKVLKPCSISFISKYGLISPSCVLASLAALADKMLALKEDNDCCSVYDRFFSLWLKKEFIS